MPRQEKFNPQPGSMGYPPVKFKFKVKFLGAGISEEAEFLEVSGLNQEFGEEIIEEGGVLDRVHKVPTGIKYPQDLRLKRGILVNSKLRKWWEDASRGFVFRPINVEVTLLNAETKPLITWMVHNAWPKKWELDALNAMENSLAMESIVLGYSWISKAIVSN